jgi:AcrR family transcriptional regulator
MYRHFDSMEALGRAVYELALAPIIQEFHSISETKPDPPTALTEALHLLYRNYDERPRALALLVFPPHDFTPWELDSENGRNPRCQLNAMLAADEDLCALCWGALIGPLQDRLLSRRVGPMSPLADAHAALVVRLLEEKP